MNITMNINIHNYQQLNLKAKLSKQLEEKQSWKGDVGGLSAEALEGKEGDMAEKV